MTAEIPYHRLRKAAVPIKEFKHSGRDGSPDLLFYVAKIDGLVEVRAGDPQAYASWCVRIGVVQDIDGRPHETSLVLHKPVLAALGLDNSPLLTAIESLVSTAENYPREGNVHLVLNVALHELKTVAKKAKDFWL